jgi:hypothetical protein
MPKLRKDLSIDGLLKTVRDNFGKIKDPVKKRKDLTLSDCLMSGLAVFGLKYPSLLQFDQSQNEE